MIMNIVIVIVRVIVIIPQKRPRTQDETPRIQGDTICVIVFDVYYRPVFSESVLGFGVPSWEFGDCCLSSSQLLSVDLHATPSLSVSLFQHRYPVVFLSLPCFLWLLFSFF